MDKKLDGEWAKIYNSQNIISDALRKLVFEFYNRLNEINFRLPDDYCLFKFSDGDEYLRLAWDNISFGVLLSFEKCTGTMIMIKTYNKDIVCNNISEILIHLPEDKVLNYII